jgi:Asp-tRNA(Asn)/Glu-tRNA(Gln) amidotransferase A subunit family amidase
MRFVFASPSGSIPPDDAFLVKRLREGGRHHSGQGEPVGVRIRSAARLARRSDVQPARSQSSGTIEDPKYLAVRDHVLPAVRVVVEGVLAEHKLDAIVYPTSSRRPALLAGPPDPPNAPSATNIANLTGFPDLIVPAGFRSGPCRWASRSSDLPSANRGCWSSAMRSNMPRRRAACRG